MEQAIKPHRLERADSPVEREWGTVKQRETRDDTRNNQQLTAKRDRDADSRESVGYTSVVVRWWSLRGRTASEGIVRETCDGRVQG